MRQAKLAELLAADGHSVSTFAIDKIRLEGSVDQKTLIREATDDAACVIMPLPVTSREGMLNAPLSSGLHTTREILSVLRPDQILCAGRVDEATYELADTAGITLIDYLNREELAVANAVAATEGAIQLIMEETPITICHAVCLVIGFGRIGKFCVTGCAVSARRSRRRHAATPTWPGSKLTVMKPRKPGTLMQHSRNMTLSSTRCRPGFWAKAGSRS